MRKRILKILLLLMVCVILGIGGIAVYVFSGLSGPIPDEATLRQLRQPLASFVYASDGSTFGKIYKENRSQVPLEACPEFLSDALVATEDVRFFRHKGIDYRSFARVFFKGILGNSSSAGGGSTLTQQLVKNMFPRRGYRFLSTPVNKIREMTIANRIEKLYTKQEILDMYLNTVSFGELAYGIGTASRRFFNCHPKDLRPEQSAALVGMLKAPSYYSPRRFPERALARRNVVLRQMARYEYIDAAYADSLKLLPLGLEYTPEANVTNLSGYFLAAVKRQAQDILDDLAASGGASLQVELDGLRIYTTLDKQIQQHAEQAVKTIMPKLQARFDREWGTRADWETEQWIEASLTALGSYKMALAQGLTPEEAREMCRQQQKTRVFSWDETASLREFSIVDSLLYYKRMLQCGLFAIDPGTGRIRAWIGGIDHRYFPYERVYAQRQVGSTFKPFVYAAALEAGVDRCKYYDNSQLQFADYKDWSPRNANGEYGGAYSLEGGLANSVNTISVQVLMDAGIKPAVNLAKRLGIRSDIPAVPSIALGTPSLQLSELTTAYTPFVNGGQRVEPYFIERIEDREGNILFVHESAEPEQVLADSVAIQMISLLENVVREGTGRKLVSEYGVAIPVAGKTGTTQNQTDGWFVGVSPNLVAGVWVGADDPRVHFRYLGSGAGGATALAVFGQFFRNIQLDPAFREWRETPFYPEAPADSLGLQIDCPFYVDSSAAEMNTYIAALRDLRREEVERAVEVSWVESVISSIFESKDKSPEQLERELIDEMNRKLDRKTVRMQKQGRSPTQIRRELEEIRAKYYAKIRAVRGEEQERN